MYKVSWQSVVMAALAGTTVSMVTYNIGLQQAGQGRQTAANIAAPAPSYAPLHAAPVPVATDAFADGPTPTASPTLTRPEPFAVAHAAAMADQAPTTAAPTTAAPAAATPTTQPASDRPAEFLVPLAIKPTGKARPSTVGRAPEPPKGAVLAETPGFVPRYGEGRVYLPANHGPVDYGYGAEYGGGYNYGYGYGYGYPSYYRPAVREQAPLLPFERGNYRTDVGYSTPKGRFVNR